MNGQEKKAASSVLDEPSELEVPARLPLAGTGAGEVDLQIATAKRFPRSIVRFRKLALEMATLDEEVAESCFYVLPRDGRNVEGPSARLAEILASAWTNMRIEGKPIGEDDRFVTARGVAWDLEVNNAIAFETKRRITTKQGRRFNDDMIGVTSNAATSIALRNAILKVVPSAFWRPIYLECRRVAVGDASTLADRRAKMLEYFQKMGVVPDRVFALIGVAGIEDITLDHLATLKGLATAIKEGDTTVDEAFPAPAPKGGPAPKGAAGKLDALADAMKKPEPAAPPAANVNRETGEVREETTSSDDDRQLDAETARQDEEKDRARARTTEGPPANRTDAKPPAAEPPERGARSSRQSLLEE